MTFAAYWIVGFVATNLDLLTAVYGFSVLYSQSHRGFSLAEPADRLHFFNFISVNQHIFTAFEQIVLKIIFESERHYWNIKLIYNTHKLENTVLAQKLTFIDKHTMRFWFVAINDIVYICLLIDRDSLFTQPDAGGNIADFVPIIYRGCEDEHGLALLFIIMRNLEDFNGFATVHSPVFEK